MRYDAKRPKRAKNAVNPQRVKTRDQITKLAEEYFTNLKVTLIF